MAALLTILSRVFGFFLLCIALVSALALVVTISTFLYFSSEIPTIKNIDKVQLQVPLRVFSREGDLIGEFGDKRRDPLTYDKIPKKLVKAFISAEDDRFFSHIGIDYMGLTRAFLTLLTTGERRQGGSTITMQLAKVLFLSSEKTYKRKLLQVFLAFKIERELSKEQIMELYLNKIYLGNRSYGVGAAAHVYYGKNIKDLTLAQMAMIAGLPKAPSRYNPLVRPKRALSRRNYVLKRMLELGHITQEEYDTAINEEISSTRHKLAVSIDAHYVAEMVRKEMRDKYGDNAYKDGYAVYTTIRSKHQRAANRALRQTLLDYDRRHGYRGPLQHKPLPPDASLKEKEARLSEYRRTIGGLEAGLVTSVSDRSAEVYLGDGIDIVLDWEGIKWAKKYISETRKGPRIKSAHDVLKPGDIIRVEKRPNNKWWLAQVPKVSGAIVAVDPKDGAITALVGGFDFFDNENNGKFNRVTQARRQPGSSFKPFVYAAALEKGHTPATIFHDTQMVLPTDQDKDWRPNNDDGRTLGALRMRKALYLSRNLVAIRILQDIGLNYAFDYVTRFGFSKKQLERNLSFALGTSVVSPLQIVSGYTVFANGGFRVEPYYITRVERMTNTKDGVKRQVIFRAEPKIACGEKCPPGVKPAKRVISEQIAYQMTSMLRDVIKRGTGKRALVLKRPDIAGKTGTTNDLKDAWFSGYSKYVAATVWVGFDQVKSLGYKEYGGTAALPMWVRFMRVALKGKPVALPKLPKGMVTVSIDPKTGLLADSYIKNPILETFRVQYVPKRTAPPPLDDEHSGDPYDGSDDSDTLPSQPETTTDRRSPGTTDRQARPVVKKPMQDNNRHSRRPAEQDRNYNTDEEDPSDEREIF